ncbi:MAG: branched-chain amino acid transport system substrate-binding protein [Actinomycetota bacterium]|jgi:ABC-type branched-subunit amino acid transport system substrate-binding protein|nr:branched-chain amino acid transport system substrate-binding protein [Actinomycetota bacterium]
MTPEQEALEAKQARLDELVAAEVTRRRFLEWATKAGMGGIALSTVGGSFLAACAKGSSKANGGTTPGPTGDTVKIGVVAPFSGVGKFIGSVVNRSTNAAVSQLNATGGIGGRKVQIIAIDTGTDPTNGPKAYDSLVSQGVVGILWCFGSGFNPSTLPLIKRDGMPVISVFNDLDSTSKLYPGTGDGPGRSVFQLSDNGEQASAVAMEYAANDRGYRTVALIYDAVLDSQGDGVKIFKKTAAAAGLTVTGIETFRLEESAYGVQLDRLAAQKPQCLFIGGLSGNTAGIVKELGTRKASYIDTPTAKGSSWHPQIIGSAGGTGDKSWIELAGADAKVGTNTVWHISGLIGNPGFPITEWAKKYQHETVTGGEEVPADGLATILEGVKKAGSTEHAKVVEGIETMGKIKFASIDFGFTKDRHIAHTKDDLVMITMERGGTGPVTTDPPYKLGVEWSSGHIFESTAAGPTHLVRPTLDGNKRAHPELMDEILRGNYGTQCTKHADGTLGKECKIH